MNKNLLIAALALSGTLGTVGTAQAQVAGSTTSVGIEVSEVTKLATGWSAKKTILGKAVYDPTGNKIGTVEDLIISRDRHLSYLIVGAGGFLGMGRHDVAIAMSDIQDQSGRLVLPGSTKDTIRAMPPFEYASDSVRRDLFVADADLAITRAKTKVGELQKESAAAAVDARAKIDTQRADVQKDLKLAETKLSELKRASLARWGDFQGGVNDALERLRKAVDA
jgi:sporulation protein YlmC with PRC-barrel domain